MAASIAFARRQLTLGSGGFGIGKHDMRDCLALGMGYNVLLVGCMLVVTNNVASQVLLCQRLLLLRPSPHSDVLMLLPFVVAAVFRHRRHGYHCHHYNYAVIPLDIY